LSESTRGGKQAAYLLDLTLRNVRCFGPEEQTLHLSDAEGRPAPWTVILGDNGVGKTTLLQCLVALEPRRHFFRNQVNEERPQVELPTGHGEGWRIYREPSQPRETSIKGHIGFTAGLSVRGPSESLGIVVPTGSWVIPPILAGEVNQRLRDLRCCGYGATRRMGSAALSRDSGDSSTSLFRDDVTLVDAEEWLLVEDYARTRGRQPQSELRLERIKKVLVELLPDVHNLRIRESNSPTKPAIEVCTSFG